MAVALKASKRTHAKMNSQARGSHANFGITLDIKKVQYASVFVRMKSIVMRTVMGTSRHNE